MTLMPQLQGVLAVGFGSEGTKDYFIVKNSCVDSSCALGWGRHLLLMPLLLISQTAAA
jgi:hypothetical protein